LADSNKTEKLAEAVMAVPKRKQSNSRTGKRRSHDRLTPKNLTVCRKCSASIPTHVVCPRCGYYNSRVVVPAKEEV
jgi:large subunit ribosomal protein L32